MSAKDPIAFQAGIDKAKQDISAGQLRIFSGAPSEGWGRDLVRTLRSRFGAEVIFTSCLVTAQSLSFEEGYNTEAIAQLDDTFGNGSYKTTLDEVDQRRKQAYDDWVASKGLE